MLSGVCVLHFKAQWPQDQVQILSLLFSHFFPSALPSHSALNHEGLLANPGRHHIHAILLTKNVFPFYHIITSGKTT